MERTVLFLLLLSCYQVQPFIITAITSLYEIYEVANDAHDTYSKVTTPSTADLMDEILDLKDQINQMTVDVAQKIEGLAVNLPRIGKIDRRMEQFTSYFVRISYFYTKFEQLINVKVPNPRDLEDFRINALTLTPYSIDATLHAIREIFVPTELGHLDDGLLVLLARSVQVLYIFNHIFEEKKKLLILMIYFI